MENFSQVGKLISLHPMDNVLVVRQSIAAGEQIVMNGKTISFEKQIPLGHKVAARDITQGEKIIKYGVPIGSATKNIPTGAHLHLHNMKSDYFSTYTLEKEFGHDK